MDNRKAMRIGVHGQICGKMILVESLEILDISMTGIRFNCAKRVHMSHMHTIKIDKDDISVHLRGTVIRASLKGLVQADVHSQPIYEVAMQFENLSENELTGLEQLITILSHE